MTVNSTVVGDGRRTRSRGAVISIFTQVNGPCYELDSMIDRCSYFVQCRDEAQPRLIGVVLACGSARDSLAIASRAERLEVFDRPRCRFLPFMARQHRGFSTIKELQSFLTTPIRTLKIAKRSSNHLASQNSKKGLIPSFHPTKPTTPRRYVIQSATRRGRGLCRVNPPSSVISNGLGQPQHR